MLTSFFLGSCRVSVPSARSLDLLNILLGTGTVYRDLHCPDGEQTAGGAATLTTTHAAARRLRRALAARGIDCTVTSLGGLPHLWLLLRRRPGLLLGLCAAAILIVLSSSTVWEINVSGCERTSADEVRRLLAAEGLTVGARLAGLNTDRIEAEVTRKAEDISWMSVNLYGTVAFVQIREERSPTRRESDFPEADGINLVAARDGVLVGYALAAGKPVPSVGSAVREGELLVSGILETPNRGVLIVRAEGEVLAQTERTVSVSVPLIYEQNVPAGREICGISLIFFGFEQKIFKNYGNDPHKCDTIIVNNYIYNKNGRIIPVGFAAECRLFTETAPATRTQKEASDLAYLLLERKIAAETAGDLVRTTVAEENDGECVTLTCTLVCLENIAREAPIYRAAPSP